MGVLGDCGGTAGIVAAAAMPAVVAGLLLAVDFGAAAAARSGLQNAADTAALAGARELMIVRDGRGEVAESAAITLAEQLASSLPVEAGSVKAESVYDEVEGSLSVEISARAESILAKAVLGQSMTVSVNASALPMGDRSLCVMGLSSGGVAVEVRGQSSIRANGCTVHANSTGTQSLSVLQRARVSAAGICIAGGYRGAESAVEPSPTVDCPEREDPLLARPRPRAGVCDHTNRTLQSGQGETWSPGVYCGGMTAENGARLTLAPGVYVVKGGTVKVDNASALVGDGVTLFLTGGARLDIRTASQLSLKAPASGPTAGMLIFGDASAPSAMAHQMLSQDAPMLLGTIYLPESTLQIGANRPVADQSPWTAIVAGRVQIAGAAAVVLNSRFDETPVPLPSGLEGGARNVRLTQ